MAKSPRRHGSVQLAFAATAVTMSVGSGLPAAASPVQDAYYAHTSTCIGLFFKDKAAHAEQCLPNTMPNSPAHPGGSSVPVPVVIVAPPPPPVVAPPPPPVIVPEPEIDSSYPEVDSSYPQVDSSYPGLDDSPK